MCEVKQVSRIGSIPGINHGNLDDNFLNAEQEEIDQQLALLEAL